jgi:hypothetical protein
MARAYGRELQGRAWESAKLSYGLD